MRKFHVFCKGAGVKILFCALLVIPLATGCSDDDTTKPPEEFAPPTNLTYINGNNQVLLSWDASPDRGLSEFAGYNVYRDTLTMVGAEPSALAALKLNGEVPVTEISYTDGTALNGHKYYYAVRSAKDNGELSEPTAEIDTAPRSEGGFVILAEFADAGRPSGFDLSEGSAYAVSSDSAGQGDNRMHVDFYLGTTDSYDDPDQPLALKSPDLVDGRNVKWADRVAGLKLLTEWDDATTGISGWLDQITLGSTVEIEGKVIAVKTPQDENGEIHYGKIKIYETRGASGQREIEIRWAFQAYPNYIRF